MNKIYTTKPFVINKNLGSAVRVQGEELTSTNADGEPVVHLTQKQKYNFDRNGWLLVPGVLGAAELEEMRAHAELLHRNHGDLPEHERSTLAGPLQKLMDHPVVVGFLNEFLAHPPVTSEDSYGFRLETSHLAFRSARENKQREFNPHNGNGLSSQECYGFSLGTAGYWYRRPPSRYNDNLKEAREFKPHNGNGLYRLPGDVHFYNSFPGKSFCPHMRVVWELNPVKYRQGGTLLISGSHKAVYTAPDEILDPDSDVWTTYECEPESLLFFAEATTHSTHPWTNEENDRIAVPTLYNQVDGGFAGALKPDVKLLESMPPLRRTLFRDRYVANNVVGADFKRLW